MNLVRLCCFNPAPVMISRKPGRQGLDWNFKDPLSSTMSVLALTWGSGLRVTLDYPNIDVLFFSAGAELLKTSLRRKERDRQHICKSH